MAIKSYYAMAVATLRLKNLAPVFKQINTSRTYIFSVPRQRRIDRKLEMHIKTDGGIWALFRKKEKKRKKGIKQHN